MSKEFTLEEVQRHNKENDLWIVIENKVFDVTKFLSDHPGGKKVLVQVAGQDATKKFNLFHKPETLVKYSKQLQIGIIGGTAKPAAKKLAPSNNSKFYGELVPYGDSSWYQGYNSPYYTDSHRKFRVAMREFVEKELMPHCHECNQIIPHSHQISLRKYQLKLTQILG
jgi:predicted heme/steroid binding protein